MLQLKKLLFVVFLFSIILLITKVHSLDPSTVDIKTKETWCNNQVTTCTNICLDSGYKPDVNYCVAETLAYDCVCSNGVRPNSTEYTQTIPYFTCTADQQTCVNNCKPATQACVDECNKVPCAATKQKPPGEILTTEAGTSTAEATGTPTQSKKPPSAILNGNGSMVHPIEGGFMLLITLVVTLFARLNST